ncbi:MAG: glycine zipper family protein [Vagococcus fluvialis]
MSKNNRKQKDNIWTMYFIVSIGVGSCFGLLLDNLAIGTNLGLIFGIIIANKASDKQG